jgi:hypothetical protein
MPYRPSLILAMAALALGSVSPAAADACGKTAGSAIIVVIPGSAMPAPCGNSPIIRPDQDAQDEGRGNQPNGSETGSNAAVTGSTVPHPTAGSSGQASPMPPTSGTTGSLAPFTTGSLGSFTTGSLAPFTAGGAMGFADQPVGGTRRAHRGAGAHQ